MAKTALSTVTNVICEEEGWYPTITARCNGVDIYPGSLVTQTGESNNDIDPIGAADEIPLGIVGLKEGHDIGTVYSDNESVPVHSIFSGAKVWTHAKANCGALVTNAPLITDGATPGVYLIPGELVNEYVGRSAQNSANDAANDRPILVWLV